MNWAERLAIGVLGIILVYLAWFIDSEEIKQTTERLDKLGNKLKEAQLAAINWQTGRLKVISAKFVSAVTKMFGESIFSAQSIGCSAAACGIPLAVYFVIYNPAEWWIKTLYALTFCYFAADATSEDRYQAQIPGAAYGILILTASPAIYKWWKWNGGFAFGGMSLFSYIKEFLVYLALPLAAPFVVGVLLVMFLSGINRGIARISSKSGNSWVFLTLFPINALVAAFFVALGKFIPAAYSYAFAHSEGVDNSQLYLVLYFLSYFVTLSLLPALGALSIGVLACGPLLHRLLWPLIRRPIQAAAFHKLLDQHKLLFTVGVYCLYLAWPENPVVRFIHDVLAKGK